MQQNRVKKNDNNCVKIKLSNKCDKIKYANIW